ncbi:MAG: DUF4783 domain-containing protein [Ignavibacteriae bacterium]|nr:DUF4783 domain-containing protein [Ignavibacteriota bacterium]
MFDFVSILYPDGRMKHAFINILLIVLLPCTLCFAQEHSLSISTTASNDSLHEKTTQAEHLTSIVNEIETALQNNSVEKISKRFTKKVSLSLRGVESGTFSANQAHYIVQEFFSKQKLNNFRFTSKGTSGEELYATGGGTLFIRGKREVVQVYIGFIKSGPSYLISQFNIY